MSLRSIATSLAACALASAMAGCATVDDVPSFETAERVSVTERDERGLWHQSENFDEQLRYSGAIYEDAALQSYLQGVTDRLFPEFIGTMRIRVLKSPVPNAFVIPNGSVYIDAGLLAFLDNEAQLAAILAHEGSHFVHRHSLKSARTAKQNLAVAAVVGPSLGLPTTAQILAYSSIMGFSRDLEREADREGFKRMLSAGYDTQQAVHVFERLARHAKFMDYDEPVFFSSHPRMVERIETFQALVAGSSVGAETNEQEFRQATAGITMDLLQAMAERGDSRALIFLLESEKKLEGMPPGSAYYLAEAYRRRGEAGDPDRAERYLRAALEEKEDHGRAHGALGLLLMKSGRNAEAREHFVRYLELMPDAPNRPYIEGYIAELGGAE